MIVRAVLGFCEGGIANSCSTSGSSLTLDKLLSSDSVLTMGRPLGCMNLKARGREKNCG